MTEQLHNTFTESIPACPRPATSWRAAPPPSRTSGPPSPGRGWRKRRRPRPPRPAGRRPTAGPSAPTACAPSGTRCSGAWGRVYYSPFPPLTTQRLQLTWRGRPRACAGARSTPPGCTRRGTRARAAGGGTLLVFVHQRVSGLDFFHIFHCTCVLYLRYCFFSSFIPSISLTLCAISL